MTPSPTEFITDPGDGSDASVLHGAPIPPPHAPAYQALIDAIEFQIYRYGSDGRLQIVNEAAVRRLGGLGVERSRIVGMTRADVHRLLLDNGYIDQRQFDDLARQHPKVDVEMAAGRSVSIRRFPVEDGGMVIVVIDASRIRRIEQIRTAEQRLSMIGSLVGGIAHEINTPLGVAVTAASFLRDAVTRAQVAARAGAQSAEQAERTLAEFAHAAALILSNLDRATELVRNVGLLTAEPAGDSHQPVRIRRQVTGVVEALAPEAARRGHLLLVDCPTDVEIETCPGALSQVLANLIVNSLRHAFGTRRGGTVLVSVARHDRDLRIVVGDDGVGIAAEDQGRIFDPFYTTRRGQGGRGLGLSIVHNLVTRRLGGFIETEGDLGEGLRQIVTIPLV